MIEVDVKDVLKYLGISAEKLMSLRFEYEKEAERERQASQDGDSATARNVQLGQTQ